MFVAAVLAAAAVASGAAQPSCEADAKQATVSAEKVASLLHTGAKVDHMHETLQDSSASKLDNMGQEQAHGSFAGFFDQGLMIAGTHDAEESAEQRSSISRRRRTSSRDELGVKLGEVKMAVTPWSALRTKYDATNRICKSGTFATCTGAASPDTPPAGCSSMCRIFQADCTGFARWLVRGGLGQHGEDTYKAMKAQMRRRDQQRRRTGRSYPLSCDFYESFNEHDTPGVAWSDQSQKPAFPWHRVEKLRDAMTGDFLVYRYGHFDRPDYEGTTGHTMIVASEPQDLGDNKYRVFIADSARSGHSADDDSRKLGGCDNGACGIGFGSMFFHTNADGTIKAYRWSSPTATLHTDSDFAIGRFNPEDYF